TSFRSTNGQQITGCQQKALMNIAKFRSICFSVLLVSNAGASCNRSKRVSSESNIATTPHEIRASITARAPDAFYDQPSNPLRNPGALLRSEPLEDVTLPTGMRGWRIPLCDDCG